MFPLFSLDNLCLSLSIIMIYSPLKYFIPIIIYNSLKFRRFKSTDSFFFIEHDRAFGINILWLRRHYFAMNHYIVLLRTLYLIRLLMDFLWIQLVQLILKLGSLKRLNGFILDLGLLLFIVTVLIRLGTLLLG